MKPIMLQVRMQRKYNALETQVMLNTKHVKERFEAFKSEGKERFQELGSESKERLEELKVEGSELAGKVRQIIDDGKVRRIAIRKGDRVLAEFPLAIGVGGAAAAVILAPTLAAVGAIGALVSDVSIVMYRNDGSDSSEVQVVDYTEADD